jgi:MSHA biogenesis protein MshK
VRQLVALSLASGCLCAFAQTDARAQGMNDPMQPPGMSAGAGEAAAPSGSGLQVVITSPGRNLALIDGVVVPLGGPVKGAKLSSVSDSVVVLRKNGDRDVLLMHPGIDKRPARRERP